MINIPQKILAKKSLLIEENQPNSVSCSVSKSRNSWKVYSTMTRKKNMLVGWLYWSLTPLEQLMSYHGGRWHTCVSWISHTSTNTTFCLKPPTTSPTCFFRGETLKCAGKKVCLNRVSNSQPPGHESDTLTTESPERGKTNMYLFDSWWIFL